MSRIPTLVVLLSGLLMAADAAAQAPVVQALPAYRERAAARADTTSDTTAKTRLIAIADRSAGTGSDKQFLGWQRVGEARGVEFWGENRGRLLPHSGLTLGTHSAALYTEIGAINSGPLRFVVGTTIAAASDDKEEDVESGDTRAAFQRFIAGGGNLSLAALRPLALREATLADQFLYIQPRGWVNVPTLGDAQQVDDLGGELSLEYQYHRFASGRPTTGGVPFLVLSVRAGLVAGTNDFYSAIGHESPGTFGYFAPSATFVVQEVLRLGISGFFAPSELTHQGTVRFSFTLVNPETPSPD